MQTVTYTYEELLEHKNSGKVPQKVIAKLREEADKILESPTAKIVDVKLPRPSGDLHDYVSMGPYWWPNPDTPDGLPYIRRDGIVNPETRSEAHAGVVYGRVHTLALATLYLGDNGYSEYANRQLYDWFINPETRTNPNAKYSQGIPGICEGRSTGLIAFCTCYNLFNGIAIFENLGGLIKPEILEGVKSWFVEFLDWILTHEYGIGADNSENNHGSWHDANVLTTAIFTNRPQIIKNICETAYSRRVLHQITEAGEQPRELARATAMHYSFYNLTALFIISNIAERLGYDKYWGVDERRGKCVLKSAVDFMYPYVLNPETFPYSELRPEGRRSALARSLLSVSKRYDKEEYEKKAAALDIDDQLWLLEPTL